MQTILFMSRDKPNKHSLGGLGMGFVILFLKAILLVLEILQELRRGS